MKKNARSSDFCADRIDVMTNFAVITNAVIKRVHCKQTLFLIFMTRFLYSKMQRTRKVCLWSAVVRASN